MKKIFLIIFLGSLLFPLITSAAGNYIAEDTAGDKYTIFYDGLVPCGKKVCRFNSQLPPEELKEKIKEIEIKKGEYIEAGDNSVLAFQKACMDVGGFTYPTTKKLFRCQFCHFFVMLDGAIDFVLFKLVPPIAILMLVIGGVMFFAAAGSPEKLGTAKKLITSVVIGLIIIFAAWIIINLFFQLIGVADWTGLQEGWFQINCPIALPD